MRSIYNLCCSSLVLLKLCFYRKERVDFVAALIEIYENKKMKMEVGEDNEDHEMYNNQRNLYPFLLVASLVVVAWEKNNRFWRKQ